MDKDIEFGIDDCGRESFPCHEVIANLDDDPAQCGVIVRNTDVELTHKWPTGFAYTEDADQLAMSILAASRRVKQHVKELHEGKFCVGCGGALGRPHTKGCELLIGDERGNVMLLDCEVSK